MAKGQKMDDVLAVLAAIRDTPAVDEAPGQGAYFEKVVQVARFELLTASARRYLREARNLYRRGDPLYWPSVVTSARTAITLRIEELMALYMVRSRSARNAYPEVLKVLQAFGVDLDDSTCQGIVHLRNAVEGKFYTPDEHEVAEVLGLAEHVVSATERDCQYAPVHLTARYRGPLPQVDERRVLVSGCDYHVLVDYYYEKLLYAVRGAQQATASFHLPALDRMAQFKLMHLVRTVFDITRKEDDARRIETYPDWRTVRTKALKELGLRMPV